MRYLNGADGLEVVLSLRDFNEFVDELRMFTMPPVLAGLERLDATDRFIAKQLAVTEAIISDWKAGKVKLPADQQVLLCKMLERGLKIYEDVLAGYDNDDVERQFYEIGVLKEHIRCADKLLALQLEMIAASNTEALLPES
jgi:hypothetical protein